MRALHCRSHGVWGGGLSSKEAKATTKEENKRVGEDRGQAEGIRGANVAKVQAKSKPTTGDS